METAIGVVMIAMVGLAVWFIGRSCDEAIQQHERWREQADDAYTAHTLGEDDTD